MYLQSFDDRQCCGFARHNKQLRIEIVDSEEKVNAFLPVLDEIMGGGLVTLERAKVIRYQDQGKR